MKKIKNIFKEFINKLSSDKYIKQPPSGPKNLSTGVSIFPSMIEDNRLYVDKTKDIYEIASQRDCFFISRPRRFGKSLLISTFKSLFEGKKDLFKNLWIGKHGSWEWKKHPIVLLDFNEISHGTSDSFQKGLHRALNKIAQEHNIKLQEEDLLKEKFKELILELYKQYNCNVVVLVDEYDKPIIDHLGYGKERLEIAKENREIMREFFGTLKGHSVMNVLRFLFITGVSKFSKVSIFSELNNLTDLTTEAFYPTLLGYTKEELLYYFDDHINQWSQNKGIPTEEIINKLMLYYDSYRFYEEEINVFNPFSVVNALKANKFKHYWFETGSPDFLIRLLKDQNINLPKIEHLKLSEIAFSTYDLDNLNINALLFQTGYLTIKDYERKQFKLGYPNMEVKTAFLGMLLKEIGQQKSENTSVIAELPYFLYENNFDSFFQAIESIFASIPYDKFASHKLDEAYFHTMFYLMVSASGIDVLSEVLNYKGRMDMMLSIKDKIFIMEFKCNQSPDAAIKQIYDKEYHKAFMKKGKEMYVFGINFSTEKRNINGWMHELVV